MRSQERAHAALEQQSVLHELYQFHHYLQQQAQRVSAFSVRRVSKFQRLLLSIHSDVSYQLESEFSNSIRHYFERIVEKVSLLIQMQCHLSENAMESKEVDSRLPLYPIREDHRNVLDALDRELTALKTEQTEILLRLHSSQKTGLPRILGAPYHLYRFFVQSDQNGQVKEKEGDEITLLKQKNDLLEKRIYQLSEEKENYRLMVDRVRLSALFNTDIFSDLDDEKIVSLFDLLTALKDNFFVSQQANKAYQVSSLQLLSFLTQVKTLLYQHYSVMASTDEWSDCEESKLLISADHLRRIVLKLPAFIKLPEAPNVFGHHFLENIYFELSIHAEQVCRLADRYFIMENERMVSTILSIAKLLSSLDSFLLGDHYQTVLLYYQKKQHERLSTFSDRLYNNIKDHCLSEVVSGMTYLANNSHGHLRMNTILYQHIFAKSQRLLSDFVINFAEEVKIAAIVSEGCTELSILLPILKGLRKIEHYDNEIKCYLTEEAKQTVESAYQQIKDCLNEQLQTSIHSIFALLQAMQFVELEKEKRKLRTLFKLLAQHTTIDLRQVIQNVPSEIRKQLCLMVDRYEDASEDLMSYYSLNPPKDLMLAFNKAKSLDKVYTEMFDRLNQCLNRVVELALTSLEEARTPHELHKKIRQLKIIAKTLPAQLGDFIESTLADTLELQKEGMRPIGQPAFTRVEQVMRQKRVEVSENKVRTRSDKQTVYSPCGIGTHEQNTPVIRGVRSGLLFTESPERQGNRPFGIDFPVGQSSPAVLIKRFIISSV